jgi:hypothetical protein
MRKASNASVTSLQGIRIFLRATETKMQSSSWNVCTEFETTAMRRSQLVNWSEVRPVNKIQPVHLPPTARGSSSPAMEALGHFAGKSVYLYRDAQSSYR